MAWWVQGLAPHLEAGSGDRPTLWVLFFGLWFIFYHSAWYWFLLTSQKDRAGLPIDYGLLGLSTDFVDLIAMMLGFIGLGLASGNYERYNVSLVFFAVLVLALTAFVFNFARIGGAREWRRFAPFFLSILLPAVGLGMHLCYGFVTGATRIVLLILLYVILVVYIVVPRWFFSLRRGLPQGITP
ncbi:MAG TPA: hypothetical protein VIS99_02755 [Terrimicrobiaceae bacterium]